MPNTKLSPLGLVPLLAALLPLGCPNDDVTPDDEAGPSLLPGDLVITEVMANPDGVDDGKEWFEIHNASGAAIDPCCTKTSRCATAK